MKHFNGCLSHTNTQREKEDRSGEQKTLLLKKTELSKKGRVVVSQIEAGHVRKR